MFFRSTRTSLPTLTAASVGAGFLYGENMRYSKAFKEDVFGKLCEMPAQPRESLYRCIHGRDLVWEDLQGIKDRLRGFFPGLKDIRGNGTSWDDGVEIDSLFGIRPEVVQDVFEMLAELQSEPFTGSCTFTPESLVRSRNWCSSYYLKHVAEWVREQRGVENHYVSNGEFILGYSLFAMEGMGAGPEIVKSLWRRDRENPAWLNVDLRMPGVFGIVEEYYARRYEDGRG